MELTRDPFPEGFVSLIDWQCGYSYNVPVELQGAPGWWLKKPEIADRIRQLRKENNITVNDALTSTLGETMKDGEER